MSSLNFLANQPLPVEIGTLAVQPDGSLRRRAKGPLNFTFSYTGVTFQAAVRPTPDGGRLQLDAELAPLPYSAEGRARRIEVEAIIAASRKGLKYGRLVVDRRSRIHVVSDLDIENPLTPVSLIAAATEMLIQATPWIAILRRQIGPAPRAGRPAPRAPRPAQRALTGPAE